MPRTEQVLINESSCHCYLLRLHIILDCCRGSNRISQNFGILGLNRVPRMLLNNSSALTIRKMFVVRENII